MLPSTTLEFKYAVIIYNSGQVTYTFYCMQVLEKGGKASSQYHRYFSNICVWCRFSSTLHEPYKFKRWFCGLWLNMLVIIPYKRLEWTRNGVESRVSFTHFRNQWPNLITFNSILTTQACSLFILSSLILYYSFKRKWTELLFIKLTWVCSICANWTRLSRRIFFWSNSSNNPTHPFNRMKTHNLFKITLKYRTVKTK